MPRPAYKFAFYKNFRCILLVIYQFVKVSAWCQKQVVNVQEAVLEAVSVRVSTVWILMCVCKHVLVDFVGLSSDNPLRWKPLSLSPCLSLRPRRQMFWIFFHRFLPGLFLGLANRTQPPPRGSRDSRVIVTLAPRQEVSASFNDLLHIRRKNLNRWTGQCTLCHCLLFYSPHLILWQCVLIFPLVFSG